MGRKFNHLTWDNRIAIESLLRVGIPIKKIAELQGKHISTIYREIKRGAYIHKNMDLTTTEKYSPDVSHNNYEKNLKCKGKKLKIGNDIEYANYLEQKIVNEKYSPEAVLLEIETEGKAFKTKICVKTFYNYIQNDVFLELTNKHLPVKRNEKREYKKIKKRARFFGKSIENRPEIVEDREDFGHWEMDCVEGKKSNQKALLVLTERKTRREIVILIPKQNVKSVLKALDNLEKELGFKRFSKMFKTITVDNGKEFMGSDKFERSCISKNKKRTEIYFCHPYSSWERGSNENLNKLIRRHLPKGTDFENLTKQEVKYIQDWINRYPRRMFKGRCSANLFDEELEKIGILL